MAGRTGTSPATFRFDTGYVVGNRPLHDCITVFNLYCLPSAIRLNKRDLGHRLDHVLHGNGSVGQAFRRDTQSLWDQLLASHVFSGVVNSVDSDEHTVFEVKQSESPVLRTAALYQLVIAIGETDDL